MQGRNAQAERCSCARPAHVHSMIGMAAARSGCRSRLGAFNAAVTTISVLRWSARGRRPPEARLERKISDFRSGYRGFIRGRALEMSLRGLHEQRRSRFARSQYVDFWNNVLVPKFVRWRHIIVDGLTLHSAKIFPVAPRAQGRQGGRCRLRLWRYRDRAGPPGRADRLGARHRLLRRFPAIRPPGRQGGGLQQRQLPRSGRADLSVQAECTISASRASARNSSRTRWRACATCARA